jgi:hypothetical protein
VNYVSDDGVVIEYSGNAVQNLNGYGIVNLNVHDVVNLNGRDVVDADHHRDATNANRCHAMNQNGWSSKFPNDRDHDAGIASRY